MRHDTAGDPITGVKWSRRTTRKIAEELTTLGIAVSKNTVGRLLKQLKFKLRVNRKQIASTKNPDRNQQFLYIGRQRERFVSQGLPIISVDTKKKEQIGNFKNDGAKWDREPVLVRDHDFSSDKLRVNRKQIASTKSPDGNQQFLYIGRQRERFKGAVD